MLRIVTVRFFMPMVSWKKNIILSVLSGLAAFAAFPPLDVSLMAWISLVPIFFVIKDTGYKGAFWYSYLAGAVFFGSVLYWLTIVSVPGFIILVIILASFYGVFGVTVRAAMRYSLAFTAIPLVWVLLEYVRAHLFTGFPWALLGHSQYRTLNLIQLADITGAYGVSFLVVMFNAAFYSWISASRRKISDMMLTLILLIAATSYGMYRMDIPVSAEGAKIGVAQGNISQDIKWDARSAESIIEKYSLLTLKASQARPDVIIWPETAYPYLLEKQDLEFSEMAELSSRLNIPLLAGMVYRENDLYYNSAVLFNGDVEEIQIYRKIHLVPFGEYVPFEDKLSGLRRYIDKPIGSFVPGKEYKLFPVRSVRVSEGPESSIIRKTVFHKIGVLICFEDVFPYVARNFVRSGAGILVNMTNDAWFGDTAASRQHLQSSVFRAVENRVPLVRAANTGISCFIDVTGKITSRVASGGRETFVDGYAADEVRTTPVKSFYTLNGDIFVYFSAALLAMLILSRYLSISREGTLRTGPKLMN